MNRSITTSLVLLLACQSSRFPGDIIESDRVEPTRDDGIHSDDATADIGEISPVEYGGPRIPPEGPSEVSIVYSFSELHYFAHVVCTLQRDIMDYRASNCRLCWAFDPVSNCEDLEHLPPEVSIEWDQSGMIVPKSLVDSVCEAMQNLPRVERMTSCRFTSDLGQFYFANIRFTDQDAYPPIEIRPSPGGDCSPHYVIQDDDMWCGCSYFEIRAIIEYLGRAPSSPNDGLAYCSCFEDYP